MRRFLFATFWVISATCGQVSVAQNVVAENVQVQSANRMNVYFLSGLGADKRVFSQLHLDSTFNVHYIGWIKPLRKETLPHYASRLIAQIDTTQPFQLVGLSFGGIIASEISNIVKPEQIILISSTSTGVPLSKGYQALVKFALFSPFAAPILKSANSIAYKKFGADTPELKKLLKAILKDTNSNFLKWALTRLSSWGRPAKAANIFHIHGANDQLIKINLVNPDVVIPNAGHLMIYAQADEISGILNRQLGSAVR